LFCFFGNAWNFFELDHRRLYWKEAGHVVKAWIPSAARVSQTPDFEARGSCNGIWQQNAAQGQPWLCYARYEPLNPAIQLDGRTLVAKIAYFDGCNVPEVMQRNDSHLRSEKKSNEECQLRRQPCRRR
jgi:hypothetical protein